MFIKKSSNNYVPYLCSRRHVTLFVNFKLYVKHYDATYASKVNEDIFKFNYK